MNPDTPTPATESPDYYVHDLSPFLIQFSETMGIRYYGLAYVLGFLIAWGLLVLYARKGKSPLQGEAIGNALFAIVVGVMVGGRLGYFLFYQPEAFFENPFVFFRVTDGGMASHGGFLGVIGAVLWLSRKEGLRLFWRLADLFVTVAPPGIVLGRIANFINGELWGRVTDVPWAVIFPQSAPSGTPLEEIAPRHPSQLYQAGLEGLIPLIYLQLRFWKSRVTEVRPGQLAGEFLCLYAVARIVGEFFRQGDAGVTTVLGLNRGAFYSLFLLFLGGLFIYFAVRRQKVGASR
ncbi:MAG: prolipoprotein diacylglyceryl transferase [Opitutales bacterium]|nr:prolipoprotein diacylglyceryl transferase [Opitutales bacterium]MCH8540128.1 prolipoprotein diacylglyceryl transferase [Opitutales bacterium]